MFIFEVVGDVIPQKHAIGRGRMFTPDSIKQYIQRIQWQIRPFAPKDPLKGPVKVDIWMYFPPPKNVSAVKRRQMINQNIHHIKTPDADNCAYLFKNAMKQIVYEDDKQIVDDHAHKRYGEVSKTIIKVIPIATFAHQADNETDI